MTRAALNAAFAAALCLPPAVASAQLEEAVVMSEFEGIAGSVIRIRTIADLEFERGDRRTGEVRMATRPYSVDGTGIVVGEMQVEGRREYLILTNHHVADASNYVLEEGGYLRVNPANTLALPSVHEESYLMRDGSEEITEGDIELTELVRLVRGDLTLMRTVGADRELPIFPGRIGYVEGEVGAGAPILTGGYPYGGAKRMSVGAILETDYPHELGLPHEDFVIDVRVEPGQSGGPVFLIEEAPSGEGMTFRLIGLIHARDRERNYAVPYRLWELALDEFPGELQDRLVR
jgi:hypothetical protein